MENIETRTENWQVEFGGDVRDAVFDEMTAWIADGSLLRIDRVRKGNLRWIEAGKVPQLVEFFNAKDAGEPIAPVVTTTNVEVLGRPETPHADEAANATFGPEPTHAGGVSADGCAMHPEAEAAFACDTCSNLFCKACPSGYGSTVKICPFCGAMCRPVERTAAAFPAAAHAGWQPAARHSGEGFGFSDFGNALAHPFKFKVSLVVGAVMFAFFSLGQSALGFGGIFMMGAALMCFMMANMLSFGVLANTVENFSQGKLDENFMPSFDDFSIWDDVVHPFFLSIGVYISSFGPLLIVVLVAVFMVVGAVKDGMTGSQDDAVRTVAPEVPYAARAANQSVAVRELIQNAKNAQQRRVDQLERAELPEETQVPGGLRSEPSEEDFQRLNEMIQNQRKAQLESAIGKTPETKAQEQQALVKKLLGYGLLFLLAGGICLLWGLFYFPAACAVAGYTRSFAATLNPTVGLDTIRRLGGSYVLILLMGLVLLILSGVVSGILSMMFFAFDLPGVGNLPGKFLGAMFSFYITVVFSCILGYALFKKADKLALPA